MSDIKYSAITISRECGAFGHTIAGIVSKKLDLPFYDKDFVLKAAEASGYSREDIKKEGETMSKTARFFNDFLGASASYVSSYDRIHEMQSEVIKDLVSKEKCILVGRCSDFILSEAGFNVLKVFLYADTDTKVKHMMDLYPDIDEKTIKKQIEKEDIRRQTYYKVYTGREFEQCGNYSICLNTGVLSPDECADIICKMAVAE